MYLIWHLDARTKNLFLKYGAGIDGEGIERFCNYLNRIAAIDGVTTDAEIAYLDELRTQARNVLEGQAARGDYAGLILKVADDLIR